MSRSTILERRRARFQSPQAVQTSQGTSPDGLVSLEPRIVFSANPLAELLLEPAVDTVDTGIELDLGHDTDNTVVLHQPLSDGASASDPRAPDSDWSESAFELTEAA